MSIKFVCSCGKRLRARDEMARRRSVCPRCGKPVGVPALAPDKPEVQYGPMSPAQRVAAEMRRIRERDGTLDPLPPAKRAGHARSQPRPSLEEPVEPVTATAPRPLDPEVVRSVLPTKQLVPQRDIAQELRWFRSLPYTFRTFPLLVVLALIWTVATAGIVFWLQVISAPAEDWLPHLIVGAPVVLILLVVLGYTAAVPSGAMNAAAAGTYLHLSWPGRDLRQAENCGLIWITALLAGPIVPIGIACLFWLGCGDPTWIDWLILFELATVAVAYWLLVVVSIHRQGSLRYANPIRVGELCEEMGGRGLAGLVAAAMVLLGPLVVIVKGLSLFEEIPQASVLMLFFGWFSGLAWCVFVFRQLGGWCYRRRAFASKHAQ